MDWKAEVSPAAADSLYGGVLFQSGRFRRVEGYSHLTATTATAKLGAGAGLNWFGAYYPPALIAGDPGARDAALHSIQGCIPHRTVVPTAVDELRLLCPAVGPLTVRAKERWARQDSFMYDMDILDSRGQLVEQWRGLMFRQVNTTVDRPVCSPGLVGPYLERRLGEIVPEAGVRVVFERRTSAITPKVVPEGSLLVYRSDGKPQLYPESSCGSVQHITASHSSEFSVAIVSKYYAGCDLEIVSPRSRNLWRDLLPPTWFEFWLAWISERADYDSDEVATRLWCAREALVKAGIPIPGMLRVAKQHGGGWLEFQCGDHTIATCILTPAVLSEKYAFALALNTTSTLSGPLPVTASLAGAAHI